MKARLFASLAAACLAAGIGGGIFLEASEAEASHANCTFSQYNYYKCVSGDCVHANQFCYCLDSDPMKNKTIYANCGDGNPFCTVFGNHCRIAQCNPIFCDPEG